MSPKTLPLSLTSKNSNRGYALLTITIITIALFLIIFIPLQIILVANTTSAQIGTDSRIAFYGAETAIHDAIAKIMDTNFTWPANAGDVVVENLTYGETQVTRTVTKVNDETITIESVSNYRGSQRTMTASMGENDITPPVDVVIVLDTSTSMDDETEQSMGITDPYKHACDGPSQPKCEPMETARQAAKTLVNTLYTNNNNARVAVVKFSGYAETIVTLTSNRSAVDNGIDNTKIQEISGTNIGDGFYKAYLELFNAPVNPNLPPPLPFIILMSDGSANTKGTDGLFQCVQPNCTTCPEAGDPPTEHTPCTYDTLVFDSATERARLAKNKGYIVYTVGLNLNSLLPAEHRTVAVETLLQSSTKPDESEHFFNAITSADLQTIYDTIGAKINESATVQIREKNQL